MSLRGLAKELRNARDDDAANHDCAMTVSGWFLVDDMMTHDDMITMMMIIVIWRRP